jgi:hypothetical protein
MEDWTESVNNATRKMKVDRKCIAVTKRGTPCRAAATDGGLCYFHANPQKAAELGRIGGRSKQRFAAENADPLPTLINAIAVRDLVARLIADLYAGKLHPRIAAGLAPLMNLQLRAIEATNLELRVAKLEERLAKTEEMSDRQRTAKAKSGANARAAVKPADG